MLIVAPRGKVKEKMLLETPMFSPVFFMVTGNVPLLLLVTKAVSTQYQPQKDPDEEVGLEVPI